MEYWVIDRIEEGWAVCQNERGDHRDLPVSSFTEPIKEGMWFTFSTEGTPIISAEETKHRQTMAANLRKRLLSK